MEERNRISLNITQMFIDANVAAVETRPQRCDRCATVAFPIPMLCCKGGILAAPRIIAETRPSHGGVTAESRRSHLFLLVCIDIDVSARAYFLSFFQTHFPM